MFKALRQSEPHERVLYANNYDMARDTADNPKHARACPTSTPSSTAP